MRGTRMTGRDLLRAKKTATQQVETRIATQLMRIADLENFASTVAREAAVGLCAMKPENKHASLKRISEAAERIGFDVLGDPIETV